MKGALLLNTQDPKLVDRGYNVAMKLAPNLVGQMTVEQLEYFEANPPELANAASRALRIREEAKVEIVGPELIIPNLRQTGRTLADWLKARATLHNFFTDETVSLPDVFALTDEELASTTLMPAFRPAGATNRMAVEWKRQMGVEVSEEVDVMQYRNSEGHPTHELYLLNRSVGPDPDTRGKHAKSPDGLIAVPHKRWIGLFGWCDAGTLHFAITGNQLDPETWCWFPEDRLPDDREVANGNSNGDKVRLYWNYQGDCNPYYGARSARKVPLKPQALLA